MKLIEWLKKNVGYSHNEAKQAILSGCVKVNGHTVVKLHDFDIASVEVNGKLYQVKERRTHKDEPIVAPVVVEKEAEDKPKATIFKPLDDIKNFVTGRKAKDEDDENKKKTIRKPHR